MRFPPPVSCLSLPYKVKNAAKKHKKIATRNRMVQNAHWEQVYMSFLIAGISL